MYGGISVAELPKQELLIKLLKMTTSSNDGEALTALRKATTLMTSAGWDWEKLIRGKITVIEDPFKDAPSFEPKAARPTEPQPRSNFTPAGTSTGRWSSGGAAASQPQPQPAAAKRPATIGSTKQNIYAGYCYCCGLPVNQQAGYIFDPAAHNPRARSKWQIICDPCNKSSYTTIQASPAPRAKAAPQPSTPLGAL